VSLQCVEGEEFYLNCSQEYTHIIDNTPVIQLPPGLTLDEAKEVKKDELATARLAEEEGGIDFNGVHIDTDRIAQFQMASAVISFQCGFIAQTKWKTNGVWVPVSINELLPVAAAVAQHVEACFAKEEALWATIDACTTVEQVEAITW